jgi:hypothetical protein
MWSLTEGFEIESWDMGEVVARTANSSEANLISIHHGYLKLALFERAQKLESIEVGLVHALLILTTTALRSMLKQESESAAI